MKKCKIKKKTSKVFKFLFITLFISIFITLYSFSNSMLIKIGETTYQAMLSSASYYAIDKSLNEEFNYENLFDIHKDKNNDIVMISTNSYKFNKLSTFIANEVNNYLTENTKNGVDVPIGVFTGISLFYGFGKKVKMPLIAINSIKCDIVSKFESGGINQTKHSIYISIIPDVAIVTRFSTKKLVDKIEILYYENLIVGKVPEIYLSESVFSTQI